MTEAFSFNFHHLRKNWRLAPHMGKIDFVSTSWPDNFLMTWHFKKLLSFTRQGLCMYLGSQTWLNRWTQSLELDEKKQYCEKLLGKQNICGNLTNIIAACVSIMCMWLFSLGGKECFEHITLMVATLNVWLQHWTCAILNVRNGCNIKSLQSADHNWIMRYYTKWISCALQECMVNVVS